MSVIQFKTTLFKIGDRTILHLPEDASAKLPTRGQTMTTGTINDFHFEMPLEPDGKWSHWLAIDDTLRRGAHAAAGDTVTVSVEPSKDWSEPVVPADIQAALATNTEASALWSQITPLARWEWVRWIRSTNNPQTRQRRIEVACSKLTAGKRRPCCWNRNLCSEPSVSKNGVLLEPTKPCS